MSSAGDKVLQDIKNLSYQLRDIFKSLGVKIPLGQCREAICRLGSVPNWTAAVKAAQADTSTKPESPAPGLAEESTLSEVWPSHFESSEGKVPFAQIARELGLQESPRISREEYAAAVQALLKITEQRGTSGAKAASLLLLSLYNGSDWQMDLTDLCLLDPKNFRMALTAIRGRVECSIEPHKLVENGDAVFHALWDRWMRYHVTNRWKQICGDCCGRGKVYPPELDEDDLDESKMVTCPRCKGEGLLAE